MKTYKTATYKKYAQWSFKDPVSQWAEDVRQQAKGQMPANLAELRNVKTTPGDDTEDPNLFIGVAQQGMLDPVKFIDISEYYPNDKEGAIRQVVQEIQQLQDDPNFQEQAQNSSDAVRQDREKNTIPGNQSWTGD